MCIFFSSISVLLSTTMVLASDLSYEQASEKVYDAARVVDANKFDDSHLSGLFKSFVAAECRGRTLARLGLSTNQQQLGDAINANSPEGMASIELLKREFGPPNVARVLC